MLAKENICTISQPIYNLTFLFKDPGHSIGKSGNLLLTKCNQIFEENEQ